VLAGIALLACSQNEELGRCEIELFGGLLTDALAEPTATRAKFLGIGQIVDDFAAFEMFGQRLSTVFVATRLGLVAGGNWGRDTTFASTTKPMLQGGIEFGLKCSVRNAELSKFSEELSDHRLKRGDVGRQRSVGSKSGGIHAPSNTAGKLR